MKLFTVAGKMKDGYLISSDGRSFRLLKDYTPYRGIFLIGHKYNRMYEVCNFLKTGE